MIIENEIRFRLPDPFEPERDLLSVTVLDNKNKTSWDIYFNSKTISSADYSLEYMQEMINVLQAAYDEIKSQTV